MGKTVVITGIGIVSPVGMGRDHFWDALFHGRTGFRPVSLFDASRFTPVPLAGEIYGFDAVPILGKKGLRELDRSTRLLNVAAKLALEDSHLEITGQNAPSIGVCVGATFGSLHSIFQFDRVGLTDGPRLVNPSFFPNTVINSPASRVAIRFGLKGFNTTISTGFCAGIDATSYAADFIRLNRADVVLAGGVEELCEELYMGFSKLGYLSAGQKPDAVCCPFDRRRNGTILSEAAGVIVLEDEGHAVRRGAPILARVAGYGNAFDPAAKGQGTNSGRGLQMAIASAIRESSLTPPDIEYISASANSTQELDKMETDVVKAVFGEHAYDIPVSAVKSMTGETFSASGTLALAATVGALQMGIIPPTVNYREKDPECDLDYVPNQARDVRIRSALVISSDPYGNNSAMVIRGHE